MTTSMLNVKILCLFEPSLNAFKTLLYSMEFLITMSGILIKLAFRWVLLELQKLLLELTVLAGLEQYS